MFMLHIDGEAQDLEAVSQPQYDNESLRIQLEDGDRSSGYSEACRHCGSRIVDESDGWQHESTGSKFCDLLDALDDQDELIDDDEADERTTAEPGPFAWCNSASITLDPDDNAVHVSISVGDPRGAFVMTVRQLSDGSLVLHHPHPSDGMAHMDTAELHPGTLAIKR